MLTPKAQNDLLPHGAMALAMVLFGLMATFSKDAMNLGLTGGQVVAFRIGGSAILFWIAALFVPSQHVERHDIPKIALASLLGFVVAQGGYIVGLSMTSPINATIELTIMPIFTLILSAFILRERITLRKALGIAMGCVGAIALVAMTASGDGRAADLRGDIMVLLSQLGYALYLTLCSSVIRKYNPFTFNKWTFILASSVILPLTCGDVAHIQWQTLPVRAMAELGYIVVFSTFLTFLLVVYAQRRLSPTTVSSYNYLQPVVAVIASLTMGLGTLQWIHLAAAALIFTGVWLVTSRRR